MTLAFMNTEEFSFFFECEQVHACVCARARALTLTSRDWRGRGTENPKEPPHSAESLDRRLDLITLRSWPGLKSSQMLNPLSHPGTL